MAVKSLLAFVTVESLAIAFKGLGVRPEPTGGTEWIVLLPTGLERPGKREVLVDLGFGFCCVSLTICLTGQVINLSDLHLPPL